MVMFFGPRFELDGSGMRPLLKMQRIEAHYAHLEQQRIAQQKAEPAPGAAAVAAPARDPHPTVTRCVRQHAG
jgi:DNA-binding IclR family transcriptional regulator